MPSNKAEGTRPVHYLLFSVLNFLAIRELTLLHVQLRNIVKYLQKSGSWDWVPSNTYLTENVGLP
jgi:hypothetical protein